MFNSNNNDEDFEVQYMDESEAIYDKKYENLGMTESAKRYTESHKQNAKLSKYEVYPHQKMTNDLISQFRTILLTAKDERPM